MSYVKNLVSIIIPTYNRYEFLLHSIQSCLNQTYKNIEIIVVNDCSTDERYYTNIIEQFEKTKVIHLPVNMKTKYNITASQGMTRQEGVNIAKGEWIAFLDDDDFFIPDKIELQLNYMYNNNCLFSCSNMYNINHNSVNINKLDFNIINEYFENRIIPNILTLNIINNDNLICNSTVLLHYSIVKKVGFFKPIIYEDWDYWKRALIYSNCYYIDIPLVYYTKNVENKENSKYYIYK